MKCNVCGMRRYPVEEVCPDCGEIRPARGWKPGPARDILEDVKSVGPASVVSGGGPPGFGMSNLEDAVDANDDE